MYKMGIDISAIFWIIVIVISIISNIAENKKKQEAMRNRAKNRPKTPPLTPAELVEKQQKLRELHEQKRETRPGSLGELFEQIFENKTSDSLQTAELKKQQVKVEMRPEQPVRRREPKSPRKSKKRSVTAAVVTQEPQSSYSFTMQDLRRAIVTKEIIDKPKALRNDSFY